MDQERKRVLTEDRLALKALGGEMPQGGADDMVGDVDLGNNSYYVMQPPSGPSQFGKLAGAALVAASLAVPTAAVAWKYMDRPAAPAATIDTDSITELRIYRDDASGQ